MRQNLSRGLIEHVGRCPPSKMPRPGRSGAYRIFLRHFGINPT